MKVFFRKSVFRIFISYNVCVRAVGDFLFIISNVTENLLKEGRKKERKKEKGAGIKRNQVSCQVHANRKNPVNAKISSPKEEFFKIRFTVYTH